MLFVLNEGAVILSLPGAGDLTQFSGFVRHLIDLRKGRIAACGRLMSRSLHGKCLNNQAFSRMIILLFCLPLLTFRE